jgi:hypothetical protein
LSRFKILLAVALLVVVATLILAVGHVSAAGDPGGSGHGIIRALL